MSKITEEVFSILLFAGAAVTKYVLARARKGMMLPDRYALEKVVGLTGFVIIHVYIASFSPAQGERNQMVNTKLTRPVNEMPMSSKDVSASL